MVGVGVALHLQQRGREVILIDRRGAGEETSYGNAGLIQREGVIPYTFPREFGTILSLRAQPSTRRRLSFVGIAATGALALSLLAKREARPHRAHGASVGAADGAMRRGA